MAEIFYNVFPKINDKLCLLMPTSGSMGSVKFVKISKENITHNNMVPFYSSRQGIN